MSISSTALHHHRDRHRDRIAVAFDTLVIGGFVDRCLGLGLNLAGFGAEDDLEM
jgi:hypothetical protein